MKIDVYFDTICPWCWVGKHNLDKALQTWEGEEIIVQYRTFFLDETIPEGGVPSKGRLQKKYGMTDQQLSAYLERLFQLGQESGVEFNYDKIEITPNTIASHMLINLASEDKKPNLIEKIFYYFFNQGLDIGNKEVLISIAREFDISVSDFERNINDPEKRKQIINDVHSARLMGVQGVPFYLINNKYAISGAQKPELTIQALKNVELREQQIELL